MTFCGKAVNQKAASVDKLINRTNFNSHYRESKMLEAAAA